MGMSNITGSATKLVLLMLVGVLSLLSVISGIHDVWFGVFSEVTKVIFAAFSSALSGVLGYYFAYKGETGGSVNTQTTTNEDGSSQVNTQASNAPPFLGK